MSFSYGLTNPCSFLKKDVEVNPDLFKFYTVVPTRSTESSAANKRRPVLYTSLNGGIGWKYESQSSGLYHANYGGNFYWNADKYHLEAWSHKSSSSSYSAYAASAGNTEEESGILLGLQNWSTNSGIPYNTTNQLNRELCKNGGITYPNRYFCIKDGGGYAYNDSPWSTANWTAFTFSGISNVTLSDDGGFCHICKNPESDSDALVFYTTNNSNKYLRFYLCNLNDLASAKDYTSIICNGSTTWKQSNYKYVSIGYLPKVGYLIFYNYSSGSKGVEVIILRTYDKNTGEKLPYDQYVAENPVGVYGTTQASVVQYGMHGWYCPWTEEYFLVPNASIVLWTKDGENWNSSSTTLSSSSTACQKFLTDGTNMIIATSGSAYYYSRNKGTNWNSGTTLSPNGFNTNRSTDTIVLPFKCINNIGIDTSQVVLGEFYGGNGNIGQLATNFRLNAYIPVDPDTSYVFCGINTDGITHSNRISFYDSNQTFISRIDSNSQVGVGVNNFSPVVATSPSNAAYARICCRISSSSGAVTQEMVDSCKWYFAKESDFKVMTEYGDIVCN